jgi:hypothetical protein
MRGNFVAKIAFMAYQITSVRLLSDEYIRRIWSFVDAEPSGMGKATDIITGVVRLPLQIAHVIGFFAELLYASACFFLIDRQIEKHASSEMPMRQNAEKVEQRKRDALRKSSKGSA